MNDTKPGADELRVRARLHHLVDGPAAEPTPGKPQTHTPTRKTSPRLPHWWQPKPNISPDDVTKPEPPQRPRDWLDDILDDTTTAAPAEERSARGPVELPGPVTKEPAQPQPKTPKKPRRQKPPDRADQQQQPAPRLSLLDAWDRTPPRVKWLAYHATAAGAGWWLGWVSWGTDTAAWYAAGHWISPSALVLYGLGVVAVALYRRSRRWAWPAAWAAAIPVSSVAVGVLLYGTGYHP